jgi:site-specific DNA recombinase
MKVALYARVSTAHQAQEQTIASPLAALHAHAAKRGFQVDDAHLYLDDGYSGSRLDRPGLDRLRDAVQAGVVERVVVYAPDRLARDYVWQQVVIADLARQGCAVEFVHGPSQETPEDRLLLQMQGMFAEYERAQILERTRRGRLHRARQGLLLVGQAPYGYRRVAARDGQPAYLEIFAPEAAVVRQLYDWLLVEGLSARQIAKRLRQQAVPPPQAVCWHPATVRNILRNPAYGGTAFYNKTRAVEPRQTEDGVPYRRRVKSSARVRPPEQWIPIPVPAIVAQGLHEQAAEQLRQNRWHAPRNVRYPYLLRGLVRCGACHLRMDGALQRSQPNPEGTRYEYAYYVCKGACPVTAGRPERCRARRVRADRLDAVVWAQVRDLLLTPDRLVAQFARVRDGASVEDGVLEQQLARLQQLAARHRRQQERRVDAYQQGVISLDELAARRGQLARQQADVDAQVTLLEQERQARTQLAPVLAAVEAFRARDRRARRGRGRL